MYWFAGAAGFLLGAGLAWIFALFRLRTLASIQIDDVTCINSNTRIEVDCTVTLGTDQELLDMRAGTYNSTAGDPPQASSCSSVGTTFPFTMAYQPSAGDRVVVYAIVSSQPASDSIPCAGGSGTGLEVASGAPSAQVNDVAARNYLVRIAGFRYPATSIFNGSWSLTLQPRTGQQSIWLHEAAVASAAHVALWVESLVGGCVVCRLKCGDVVVEYRIPASEWRPLGENLFRFSASSGVPTEADVPKTLVVAPA